MATSIEPEKYEVLEKIGHGSFGIIHKVRRKSDKKEMCRKEISYVRMSQKEREQLQAEFSILNSLRHPNIVGYYHREHLKASQELHIYMEYCNGGDLSQVIKSLVARNQLAEEEYVWSIFAQLVTALYRCHYGADPPEVGKNFMGPDANVKPPGLRLKNQVMILHRDLKPENVFLGADNSVKLGDFGLSKLMQSHDFASTYVGTPFYMSPEICAAERYTLHSDVWSLGCIMYELCARKPPFDAKTHLQLVQRIRDGRYDPLPSIYSPELQNVIKSCLKTNPQHRPDTAALLRLPIVRLMRKEREVVEIGRILKIKEEDAQQQTEKLKLQIASLDLDKEKNRSDIEATVRREWEVKARLEIDRQVQVEVEKLRKIMDAEVQSRVQLEVEKHLRSLTTSSNQIPCGTTSPNDVPLSSVSTSTDYDFPSTTDLSSLSLYSPRSISKNSKPLPLKRSTRTPFTRARTTYDSPMDVHMTSPSPISISSLSLSPRRTNAPASTLPNPQNIFAAAAEQRLRWEPTQLSPATSEEHSFVIEDDDELPDLPSPSIPRYAAGMVQDPFKLPTARPGLRRQNTAPMRRLPGKPSIFNGQMATIDSTAPALSRSPSAAAAPRPVSPNRRLSKVPFLVDGTGSPTRKFGLKQAAKAGAGGEDMFKAVLSRNLLGGQAGGQGRTLVELSQGRVAAPDPIGAKERAEAQWPVEGAIKIAARVVSWENLRENHGPPKDVAMWDPETDEMPSPFLARKGRLMR
ncbi:G2-specific serine/threonine protein kinase [Xylographa opegraphella]|nr:G2-specific serine/threonine protein kinase [Xylographa opegraphella]